jgi:hypothetical protein
MTTIEEMETVFQAIDKKNDKVKLSLLSLMELKDEEPFCQNKDEDIECAICYKRIYNQKNKVFVCSDPCNKVFHPSCMERMIEQIDESAYQADEDAHYRCCYCRRDFDINYYNLELFMRELLGLKASGGYYVDDVIKQATKHYLTLPDDIAEEQPEPFSYEIVTLISLAHIKKPKQSKNALFKLQKNRQHNNRLTKNGNRR